MWMNGWMKRQMWKDGQREGCGWMDGWMDREVYLDDRWIHVVNTVSKQATVNSKSPKQQQPFDKQPTKAVRNCACV